jgi:hypothetical protein
MTTAIRLAEHLRINLQYEVSVINCTLSNFLKTGANPTNNFYKTLYYINNTVTCRGVCMMKIVGSIFDLLDLLYVSVTITLDKNGSHIEVLLDNESLTVV